MQVVGVCLFAQLLSVCLSVCASVYLSVCLLVFARDSTYAKRTYAIAIPSVCPSVRPSVTRVIHAKTVEARIMQFSQHNSPIPLVFVR